MSSLAFQLASRHAAWQYDARLVKVLSKARRVSPGEPILLDGDLPIKIETFSLPHSIPQAMGLVVKGERARIVHLSDFKFSGMESRQKAETIAVLKRIAQQPVDVLALNIINVHIDGFTPIESLVIDALTDILVRAKGRVIISCFSTNLERIRRINEVAKLLGRPVQFLGAGMENSQELLGITGEEGDLEEAIIFVTGCQAEEQSVLWRVMWTENLPLSLKKDDVLILSSRCIPGNESLIKEMTNALSPSLAKIIVNEGEKKEIGLTDPKVVESLVHVSGHGAKEDIRLALEILNPKKVLAWPQTSPQSEIFQAIAEPFGIKILPESQRVIEI